MRVLFDCQMPSLLAHGGAQIQAANTVLALREIGVAADYVHWWDPDQKCDVLHFLGRANSFYTHFAKAKNIKFVMADLLTSQGSRNRWQRLPHWFLRQFDRVTRGRIIAERFGWTSYRMADAVVALTPWEKMLMAEMFGVNSRRIFVVPNGVEEVFFLNRGAEVKHQRSEWLICTATITERKRVLELAEAAILANTPVWIVGKPYSETDGYYLRFLEAVRRSNGLIRYEGGISDRSRMAEIYKSAKGFVLLSTMESLSLSALEAAAAGCPLLLSDLPWARCTFEQNVSYCPITNPATTSRVLKQFYAMAPTLPIPHRPNTWKEVAIQLKGIYEEILASPA